MDFITEKTNKPCFYIIYKENIIKIYKLNCLTIKKIY